jgi:hypothetical protein
MCCWPCAPNCATAGVFDAATQPKLDTLLPLVALGTVADVVRLDANNRRLVAQGLKRVRALAMPAGLASLFVASGRTHGGHHLRLWLCTGPRINAAGRLSDMTLGIECLLTDDPARADELAKMLDGINRERRVIEGDMREQAMLIAESLFEAGDEPPPAICVFDPTFTKAWWALWPRASRTSCTARPLCLPPARTGQGARTQRFGPLHPRLSPARRAGPGGQAPPRRAAAFWRPRHGGRLHHPEEFRRF